MFICDLHASVLAELPASSAFNLIPTAHRHQRRIIQSIAHESTPNLVWTQGQCAPRLAITYKFSSPPACLSGGETMHELTQDLSRTGIRSLLDDFIW